MERFALTSDYASNKVGLKARLERMAQARFSEYMHCHGWKSSELYTKTEMEMISKWTMDIGINLVDVHASAGEHGEVWHEDPEIQDKGVELVQNRAELAAKLGSDVIVLHAPAIENSPHNYWGRIDRFITRIEPRLKELGVKIAFENLDKRRDLESNFRTLMQIFGKYPSNLVGLCYDSGHGNVDQDGLDNLEKVKDRLIAVHLHDNKGQEDEHDLMFTGTVDWQRLAKIIATSSYKKPLSTESSMRDTLGVQDVETRFLIRAREAGTKFAQMVKEAKNSSAE